MDLVGLLAMGFAAGMAGGLLGVGGGILFVPALVIFAHESQLEAVATSLVAIVLVFGVAMAPAGGATGSLFSLMFGAEVRYTGVSVGYTLSQITGSAFAPLIAVALYGAFGNTNALVIYLLAASAVSITVVLEVVAVRVAGFVLLGDGPAG